LKYVYFLESLSDPQQTYVGLTNNLRTRLTKHNAGESPHTSKYRPWRLLSYLAFSRDQAAVDFERYLKTGSGRAFAKKRLR
jgi:putative endonuclease